jgi:ABC-type transport system involved in multi-copper enzyme maturation permease subunit
MSISRSVRNSLWMGLGYFIALELMIVAAILFWPSFEGNTGALKVLAAPIPMLREMFEQLEAKGVSAYVLSQHFFKGCNVLGCAVAALIASNAIAGEAHRGTLEILLLRPLSRKRILLERWLLGAAIVIVPVFLTTLTVPMLLARVDEAMEFGPLMLCAVHQSLFLLCIYAITFLISTVGRAPLQIAFGMLVFAIFNFSIYMVKTVTHWSLFRLADMQVFLDVYESGTPPLAFTTYFLIAIGGSLAASIALFERRVP